MNLDGVRLIDLIISQWYWKTVWTEDAKRQGHRIAERKNNE